MFKDSILAQEASNRRLHELIYKLPDLVDAIKNYYLKRLYRQLREGGDGGPSEGAVSS